MRPNYKTNYTLQQKIKEQMHLLRDYDENTFQHSIRTARLASWLATQIAQTENLSQNEIATITIAALLHDIGKIYIPIEILNKKEKLTEEEFNIIKTHPTLSAKHLAKANFDETIQRIVSEHHENFDGTGYPNKKQHNQLHKLSNILRVADTFDAMKSERAYKAQISLSIIYQEFQHDNSHCYDPKITQYILQKQ